MAFEADSPNGGQGGGATGPIQRYCANRLCPMGTKNGIGSGFSANPSASLAVGRTMTGGLRLTRTVTPSTATESGAADSTRKPLPEPGGALVQVSENAALGLLGERQLATDAKTLSSQLAVATRNRFETDYALVVGPVHEPSGGGPAKIWLALADGDKTRCVSLDYLGHPDILAERAAKQSLNLLRKTLLNFGGKKT